MASPTKSNGHDANGDGDAIDARFVFGDGSSDGDGSGDAGGGVGGSGDGSGGASPIGKRGRGRPKGSGKGRQTRTAPQESVSASIDGLSRALLLLHFGIANGVAMATKNRALGGVFVINPEEARLIAEPAAELMSHYVGARSPEAQRWINLVMALGAVYGGKVAQLMIAGPPKNADTPAPA